jgi:hypothetical protein
MNMLTKFPGNMLMTAGKFRILRMASSAAVMTALLVLLTSCGGGGSNSNNSGGGDTTTAPAITSQPQAVTVTAGASASFSVTATGTAPLNYQWQMNGSNISGATSSTYNIASTTTSQNGQNFAVVVSNSAGSVTSNSAKLTVNAASSAPVITVQPISQEVVAGSPVTFTVVATGSGTLSYQWQMGGSNVGGATSASYTISSTTMAQNNETFDVVVSNSVGSTKSATATLTVTNAAVAPSITVQPANKTVTEGETATFSVTATGTSLSYQWQSKVGSSVHTISGATSASYTTPATTISENGTQYAVVVSNSLGNVTSNYATLTVNSAGAAIATDVTTYHNNIERTGLNNTENTLNQGNVNEHTFGLLGSLAVDGLVDAEPLFLSNLSIGGTQHDVVFVVTENDSVSAFDANTRAQLWHDGPSALLPSGETASNEPDGCSQIGSEIGITSTPVIDRNQGAHGTMYLVTMSIDGSGGHHHRIHALDVTTGAELLGGPTPITATYPGVGAGSSGGTLTFNAVQYKERAALLLLNGVIYTTWASHCDVPPYSAWVMGYNESNLHQSVVFNLTPNGANTAGGSFGAGSVWMSGGGPAADPQGNIYLALANGAFETTLNGNGFPSQADYGNALVRMTPGSGALSVTDYFNMSDTINESDSDQDLGSGGVMVIPDQTNSSGGTVHLVTAAGKDGNLYVANRDNMGRFSSSANNIYQLVSNALPNGVWGVSAYFNGTIYACPKSNTMRAFPISQARVQGASSQTSTNFEYPGALPSVSANGTVNGIVWAIENTSPPTLHAYAAGNLQTELYNSAQAPNDADHPNGSGNKFVTPMIAMGKVFVATSNSVAVYGVLGSSR